jgi:lipopolysaccharide export system protein LptA
MRSLRWLLLVVIAVVAAGVFQYYRLQREASKAKQRPAPPAMALDDKADAVDWEWGQSANGMPNVHVKAEHMHQAADGKVFHLSNIELRIYQKSGKAYDRVHTDTADFDNDSRRLTTQSEAEITLDVPVTGEPKHPLTSIKAAGINFDSDTGMAVTDKHVSFVFEGGTGVSEGAAYDPATHAIHLMHGVVVHMKSKNPKGRPMKVETEDLVYSETALTVKLTPWAKLTRDQTVMVAGATTVNLKNYPGDEKKIDTIEAPAAHGTDLQQGRNLDYSADLVKAFYNEHGEMEKLNADGRARLVSRSKAAETTMTGAHLDLGFNATANDSVLQTAQARGNAVLESKPIAIPNTPMPDTKDIHSDAVDVFMKPDGKDVDHVATLAPGTMEFLPNQAARSHRLVKSDKMLIKYGAKNEIESFHADNASTETHPSQAEVSRKTNPKPANQIAVTSSRTMDVAFDEKGEVKEITQTGRFRYSEGVRKAESDTAVMDNAKNLMDLDAHARVSDDSGSTAADHIQLNQATDEFDARGHVATTHLPDQKPATPPKPGTAPPQQASATSPQASSGGMLDSEQPLQGKADRVLSADHGKQFHYITNAQVWQGGSRITADTIDIDRDKKTLNADGHVFSQLQDAAKTLPNGKPGPIPPTTLVRSQKLAYTDSNRLAVYSGDVSMVRSGLTVKCVTLQAFMNDGKPVDGKTPDSRIDRATADGKVEVVQSVPPRQRIGTSEHAEYYTGEGKIVLTGGQPYLKDTKEGDAHGDDVTYFTNDDKLIIDGAPKTKVQGNIIRAKGKS